MNAYNWVVYQWVNPRMDPRSYIQQSGLQAQKLVSHSRHDYQHSAGGREPRREGAYMIVYWLVESSLWRCIRYSYKLQQFRGKWPWARSGFAHDFTHQLHVWYPSRKKGPFQDILDTHVPFTLPKWSKHSHIFNARGREKFGKSPHELGGGIQA